MYDQTEFYQEMQSCKREAVNIFWEDWLSNSKTAAKGGIFLAILLTGFSRFVSHPIRSVTRHPVLPLYLGIAGGVALS